MVSLRLMTQREAISIICRLARTVEHLPDGSLRVSQGDDGTRFDHDARELPYIDADL
jgi:hypothetical protein